MFTPSHQNWQPAPRYLDINLKTGHTTPTHCSWHDILGGEDARMRVDLDFLLSAGSHPVGAWGHGFTPEAALPASAVLHVAPTEVSRCKISIQTHGGKGPDAAMTLGSATIHFTQTPPRMTGFLAEEAPSWWHMVARVTDPRLVSVTLPAGGQGGAIEFQIGGVTKRHNFAAPPLELSKLPFQLGGLVGPAGPGRTQGEGLAAQPTFLQRFFSQLYTCMSDSPDNRLSVDMDFSDRIPWAFYGEHFVGLAPAIGDSASVQMSAVLARGRESNGISLHLGNTRHEGLRAMLPAGISMRTHGVVTLSADRLVANNMHTEFTGLHANVFMTRNPVVAEQAQRGDHERNNGDTLPITRSLRNLLLAGRLHAPDNVPCLTVTSDFALGDKPFSRWNCQLRDLRLSAEPNHPIVVQLGARTHLRFLDSMTKDITVTGSTWGFHQPTSDPGSAIGGHLIFSAVEIAAKSFEVRVDAPVGSPDGTGPIAHALFDLVLGPRGRDTTTSLRLNLGTDENNAPGIISFVGGGVLKASLAPTGVGGRNRHHIKLSHGQYEFSRGMLRLEGVSESRPVGNIFENFSLSELDISIDDAEARFTPDPRLLSTHSLALLGRNRHLLLAAKSPERHISMGRQQRIQVLGLEKGRVDFSRKVLQDQPNGSLAAQITGGKISVDCLIETPRGTHLSAADHRGRYYLSTEIASCLVGTDMNVTGDAFAPRIEAAGKLTVETETSGGAQLHVSVLGNRLHLEPVGHIDGSSPQHVGLALWSERISLATPCPTLGHHRNLTFLTGRLFSDTAYAASAFQDDLIGVHRPEAQGSHISISILPARYNFTTSITYQTLMPSSNDLRFSMEMTHDIFWNHQANRWSPLMGRHHRLVVYDSRSCNAAGGIDLNVHQAFRSDECVEPNGVLRSHINSLPTDESSKISENKAIETYVPATFGGNIVLPRFGLPYKLFFRREPGHLQTSTLVARRSWPMEYRNTHPAMMFRGERVVGSLTPVAGWQGSSATRRTHLPIYPDREAERRWQDNYDASEIEKIKIVTVLHDSEVGESINVNLSEIKNNEGLTWEPRGTHLAARDYDDDFAILRVRENGQVRPMLACIHKTITDATGNTSLDFLNISDLGL